MGPERDFYEGVQRTKHTERQPRVVVDLINYITKWLNWYQVPVS